jgi:hypothetical protein
MTSQTLDVVRGLSSRKNTHKMRATIWNSEGLRDPCKIWFIQETIREQKLDFIALLETGRSNFTVQF